MSDYLKLEQLTTQTEQLTEENEKLRDINYELEQNLLAAKDQNHYFKLMSLYRDKTHELEQEFQKTREQLEKAAVLMKTQKDCIDHLLGKKESFGDKSTIGFGKRVDDFLDKYFKDNQGEE